MSTPLSYTEKLVLNKQIEDRQNIIDGQKSGKKRILEVSIPENDQLNTINSKMYGYYHSIISCYEAEKSGITGQNLAFPLVESDFLARIQYSGRLYLMENPDIVRIPEFDSGGDTVSLAKEGDFYPVFSRIIDRLTTGLDTVTAYNGTNLSSIGPGSTSIQVNSGASVLNGKEFLFRSTAGVSFVGKATDFRTVVTGTPPSTTTTYYLDFQFLTPISSTIAVNGSNVLTGTWNGFSNVERSSKTSVNQTVLNFWLSEFDVPVDGILAVFHYENDNFLNNPDDGKDMRAGEELETVISFFDNFKIGKDVSDSGISAFEGIVNNRQSWISSRLLAIDNRKAEFFDKRFNWAVLRAGRNGSMNANDALQRALANADNIINSLEAEIAIMKDL